mmetsp:Transcript_61613/g.115211  ORF Transcript_61613/g.115211 Transcript_61613/m.115211 type:complete len:148 (+) Transcript_61613:92-535(+)
MTEGEVDAARIDPKDGHVMLGHFRKREGVHSGQVDAFLRQLQAQRAKEKRPMAEDAKKVLKYCKRFKPLTNEIRANTVKTELTKLKLNDSGRYVRYCRDYEATQLLNLLPATPEEARKLIPTLEQNNYVEKSLELLAPLKDFDRNVQ